MAFFSSWVTSPVPTVISAVNATPPRIAPGRWPRGPTTLAVSNVKVAKYSAQLSTSRPARTGIVIA